MPTYDKAKIGKLLAWGGDHFVYEYGADHVIKFSQYNFVYGRERALRRCEEDYEICMRYLGSYLLGTTLMSSPDGRYIAQVQPKIVGRGLVLEDLKDKSIHSQFQEIARCYDAMLADHLPHLDVVGSEGIRHGGMGNIFITPERRLVLFDASLFNLRYFAWWQRLFLRPLFVVAGLIQSSRFKSFRRA